uniref:Putative ATP-dependent Zn protease n=1 Tax=Apple proliferation phytoplasma TaxID=37692 RepID=M1WTW4_APPPP|nr:putative ATP-dependent Zn protease [Candidatus Phytoplasma mali]
MSIEKNNLEFEKEFNKSNSPTVLKSSKLIVMKLFLLVLFLLLIIIWVYMIMMSKESKKFDQRIVSIEEKLSKINTEHSDFHSNEKLETNSSEKINSNSKNVKSNPPNSPEESNEEDRLQFQPADTTKFLPFDKLIGFKEEKVAVDGFIDYMRNKTNYENIGDVEPPLGILLYGCPGTGKTTLARAVAKEIKLPFFEVPSSMFSQKYRGIATQMVKDLFDKARELAEQKGGAIIFLDECETIFVNINNLEANAEVANVVNAFKTEMTLIDNNPNKPVFVIGATNHIDQLEEAIKSRFTYNIEVKPFERKEREEFLKFMINRRKNPYSDEAKNYLFKVINVALDDYQGENSFLKSNRTLENILKTAVNIFAKNRKIVDPKISENYRKPKLRDKIQISDLKTAYSMVVSKDTAILDKIENSSKT